MSTHDLIFNSAFYARRHTEDAHTHALHNRWIQDRSPSLGTEFLPALLAIVFFFHTSPLFFFPGPTAREMNISKKIKSVRAGKN